MAKKATRARCKECGAPIRWAITPARKNVALDYSSDPHGTYTINRQRNYGTGEMETIATPLTTSQREHARNRGELIFLAHAASCPAIDRPRKIADPDRVREMIDRLNLPDRTQPPHPPARRTW